MTLRGIAPGGSGSGNATLPIDLSNGSQVSGNLSLSNLTGGANGTVLAGNGTFSSFTGSPSIGNLTLSGIATSPRYTMTSAGVYAYTANITLNSTHNGAFITMNSASTMALTVPSGLGAAFSCTVAQIGAGNITLTPSSTTILSYAGFTKTAGLNSTISLFAPLADTLIVAGNMQP